MAVTIITETYNHAEGQSWSRFERAVRAAIAAAEDFDDGTDQGPNHVLVVDASSDTRAEDFVSRLQTETSVPLRHRRVPVGSSYDQIKDLGALEATTPVIAYLDGDCAPAGEPSRWLRSLFTELVSTGAPGVCGTTIYDRDSPLGTACSALDFGFVHYRRDGVLTSYTSNNAMFKRAVRAEQPADTDGLRCSCYLHAQLFLREGTPMRHARSSDALVIHEFPPLWKERFRRGYDTVAMAWEDPTLFEARCFRGPRSVAATVGVARFLVGVLPLDAKAVLSLRHYRRFSRSRAAVSLLLVPLLRSIDVLGIWRALLLGRNPRWRHPVTTEDLQRSPKDNPVSNL